MIRHPQIPAGKLTPLVKQDKQLDGGNSPGRSSVKKKPPIIRTAIDREGSTGSNGGASNPDGDAATILSPSARQNTSQLLGASLATVPVGSMSGSRYTEAMSPVPESPRTTHKQISYNMSPAAGMGSVKHHSSQAYLPLSAAMISPSSGSSTQSQNSMIPPNQSALSMSAQNQQQQLAQHLQRTASQQIHQQYQSQSQQSQQHQYATTSGDGVEARYTLGSATRSKLEHFQQGTSVTPVIALGQKRMAVALSLASISLGTKHSEMGRAAIGADNAPAAHPGLATGGGSPRASVGRLGKAGTSSMATIDLFSGGPSRSVVDGNTGGGTQIDRYKAVSDDRLSRVSESEQHISEQNGTVETQRNHLPTKDSVPRQQTPRSATPYACANRAIGLSPQIGVHEVLLPQFDEYPIVHNVHGNSIKGLGPTGSTKSQSEPRTHKTFSKPVLENPHMFDQQFPVIIPFINNEPVALKIMNLYNQRWSRRSIRSQLPPLTKENIRVFLFHLARVGDLEALKIVCKSPAVDLESSDDEGRTALIFAAIGGHAHCVRLLASLGAFINRQDQSGRTALHWSAYHGCLAVAKELGDSHADMLQEDYQGKSPLHCATYPESVETLEYLVKTITPTARRGTIMVLAPQQRRKTIAGLVFPEDKSGPCNAVDLEQMTPLMWAAYHGHDKHIETLLAHGRASAFLQDIEGKTALHWATANRHGRCCEILLAKFPALINISDHMGRVPLHYACGEGNIAVVEMILRAPGSNPNAQDALKRTPLHWAAVRGHPACINILCQNGARIEMLDEHGASPLNYAVQQRKMDCVHVLLRKGAAVNSTDVHGRTPLMWTALLGNLDLLKMLFKANAKAPMRDKNGMSALHFAAYAGHTACCMQLTRLGAQVGVRDKYGQTPIFKAAMMGWESIVTVLANEGANVDEQDNNLRTASHWAASGGYMGMLQLLFAHDAAINVQDSNGRTPLHEAAFAGSLESVEVLLNQDVDTELKDVLGATPLHLAASCGYLNIIKALIAGKANVNARDNPDIMVARTPLDFAREGKHKECVVELRMYAGLPARKIAVYAVRTMIKSWRASRGMNGYSRRSNRGYKYALFSQPVSAFAPPSPEQIEAATRVQAWFRGRYQRQMYLRMLRLQKLEQDRALELERAEAERLHAQQERELAEIELQRAIAERQASERERIEAETERKRMSELLEKQKQELAQQMHQIKTLMDQQQSDQRLLMETQRQLETQRMLYTQQQQFLQQQQQFVQRRQQQLLRDDHAGMYMHSSMRVYEQPTRRSGNNGGLRHSAAIVIQGAWRKFAALRRKKERDAASASTNLGSLRHTTIDRIKESE